MKRNVFSGLALLVTLSVGGCMPHWYAGDSYHQATTPNPSGPYVMDPGSYGGTAYASGGLDAGASYGTGANGAQIGNPKHYDRMNALLQSSSLDKSWDASSTEDPKKIEDQP